LLGRFVDIFGFERVGLLGKSKKNTFFMTAAGHFYSIFLLWDAFFHAPADFGTFFFPQF
jgi:hypothetical protein